MKTGPRSKSLKEKFWSNVQKTNRCWLWTGTISVGGYGAIHIGSRTDKNRTKLIASRVSWMLNRGEIPTGKLVCHTCDNRRCVNPAHLFIGSHEDNSRDMMRKGRGNQPKGVNNYFAKLNDKKVRQIRKMYQPGKTRMVDIAAKFGVSYSVIYFIINRQSWKHVSP